MRWWIVVVLLVISIVPAWALEPPTREQGPQSVCNRVKRGAGIIRFYSDDQLVLRLEKNLARRWKRNCKMLGRAFAVEPERSIVNEKGEVVWQIYCFEKGAIMRNGDQQMAVSWEAFWRLRKL